MCLINGKKAPFIICLSLFLFAGTVSAFDQKHALLARVLNDYTNNGRVDYRKLKAEPGSLNDYLESLAQLRQAEYDSWSKDEKIAFWVNAYNALTLKVLIEYYPIRPTFFASLRHPENSIRQIPGAWDKIKFRVMEEELTLNQIEHDILRKSFREPRVHMALVCASLGCPQLRGEPFTGNALDSQLNEQTSIFLNTPSKFKIDKAKGEVSVSPIFKWFGEDFVEKYLPATGFPDHAKTERAALNFISRYLDESGQAYLKNEKYKVLYLDYDWSLNEQR